MGRTFIAESRPRHSDGTKMNDTTQFGRQVWLTSRRMVLLAAASLPSLGIKALRANAAFTKITKAVWVWKDRILAPDDLASFCERYQIEVLFLYLTPQAGESLLSGADNARKTMASLRTSVEEYMPALVSQIG